MSCEVCRERKMNDRAQLEFNLARDAKNNKSFGQKMKIKKYIYDEQDMRTHDN